jgi:hypothetical protein
MFGLRGVHAMRGQFSLMLGFFLTASLTARDLPAAEPGSARMIVSGRVLDPSGKPVPNAKVMVYALAKLRGVAEPSENDHPSAIGQATSDGTGRFEIDAPRTSSARTGLFGVLAGALGFGADWVELDPDDEQPSAEITLRPERVIEGQLLDLKGAPASDVQVLIRGMLLSPPVRTTSPRRDFLVSAARIPEMGPWPQPVKSDAQGRFTVRGVGRDVRALVNILDPRYATEQLVVDTTNGTDPQRVTVSLQPPRSVRGRVTYADTGLPAAHARIDFTILINHSETDGEGRFEIHAAGRERTLFLISPPKDQPYLGLRRSVEWNPGEIVKTVDFALPRGALVRGKVTEEGSGKPVERAEVIFHPGFDLVANPPERGSTVTGSDGSFQFGAMPRPGTLIVTGPSHEYVLREIGQQMTKGAANRRVYAHAIVPLDPKLESDGQEVAITIRRGITVEGRVIDPDGQPVDDARMISVNTGLDRQLRSSRSASGTVHTGRFKLFGFEPDVETPAYFLEPKRKLGATVYLSGKSAVDGPMTVRLEPCGKARIRLVDSDKKPLAKFHEFLATMIVTRGSPLTLTPRSEATAPPPADESPLVTIDPTNYGKFDPGNRGLSFNFDSDQDGRLTLPVLIPGATYRIYDSSGQRPNNRQLRKEFVARSGETLDLGDILIANPRSGEN